LSANEFVRNRKNALAIRFMITCKLLHE
jgi:hypothetical protein